MTTNPRLTAFAMDVFEDRLRMTFEGTPREVEIETILAERKAAIEAMGTETCAEVLLRELPDGAFHVA